jgi:Carboxypeptidase regulatory-like domain
MQSISAKSMRALVLVMTGVLFGFGVLAYGQGTSGSLTGLISDPTGAVVAGASVTLTNLGTNYVQAVNSDATGVYLIKPVEPGNYSLRISATGFAKYVQTGIVIHANEYATQDVHLKVGTTGETISVTADAELINTTTPELGMTVNESSVSQLPLNGRDPSNLVWLAPGVINANMGNSYTQSGFSFPNETDAAASGGRQGSTYYILDGAPNMDTYLGRAAPFPNADATQEFTVVTNNFNAVYGFAPGAVVSIQVKSGTNEFHGGLFEFLRDNDFNAKDWFTHSINPLHQNQFGAYAGGPILKNRVFIFGNYQGTRAAFASSENQTYAPTAAMLAGDFSGLSSTLCTGGESAICPFTTINGKPNQLDTSSGYAYNATALQIVKDALPQVGKTGVSTTGCTASEIADGCVEYTSAAIINNYDEGTARLDWDASSSQRVSLISYVNNLIQPSGDTPGNVLSMLPLSTWQYTFAEKMQYINETLNHTWTISPTMVNVASVFWTQMAAHNGSAALTAENKPFCWSSYINVTELPGTCYLEGFDVSGGGFESGWYEPSQEERTTYGLYDNFSKSFGKHTIQAGMNLQHQFAEEYTQYPTEAELQWGGTPFGNGTYTGSGLADYLVGDLYTFTQGAGEIAPVSGWQPGFFGQDSYRLRPNINLTLGLRWDPNLPPQVTAGRAAAWVPGQQSTVYPNAPKGLVFPGDEGIGAGLMDTTYGYWEPRLGVAWQPKGLPKTSIHAGFGMFTQPMIYSTYNHTVDNAPFAPTYSPTGSSTTPLNFNNPWSTFTGTGGVNPFPPFASATSKPGHSATFSPGLSVPATISPSFKLGVTQAWNVSVEQGFRSNMVARVAYVGTETYHQSTIIDQNPGVYGNSSTCNRELCPIFAGNILDMLSPGTASYNSLQLTGEWKQSHGLQFQSNLTWSKAIDDTSSSNISFGYNAIGDPFNLAWSRGISSQSFPIDWVSNFVYTSPALHGHGPLLEEVLGGWEMSGIYNWISGAGLTIESDSGASGSDQGEDRANFVSGQALDVKSGSRSQWLSQYFNTKAFTTNPAGTFGDTGKNIMRAPHTTWGDAGIDKNWRIAERYGVKFRWEFFNAFNHPSFGSPGTNLTWGGFGQISGTGSEPPRVMQGALKFMF